jgi:hypothetical protein
MNLRIERSESGMRVRITPDGLPWLFAGTAIFAAAIGFLLGIADAELTLDPHSLPRTPTGDACGLPPLDGPPLLYPYMPESD